MANVQMIAVWGSTGAGKTLISAKLARELAALKKNVMLVLCDDETPGIPLLLRFPGSCDKSLGALLSAQAISQSEILRHCAVYNNDDHISVLGYLLGEYGGTYAGYSAARVKELYSLLRGLCDYVIVDCPHALLGSKLAPIALETADCVLRVTNADVKSSLYIASQKLLLAEERFHYKDHLNVINAVQPNQNTAPFEENLGGGKAVIIPYSADLKEQFDGRCLPEGLFGKEAKRFNAAMKTLVKEITEHVK